MNSTQLRLAAIAALLSLAILQGSAQGTVPPLTLQGLDQPLFRGARSAAMGGAATAACGDAAALFSNPAALSRLGAIEVRVGFSWTSDKITQMQAWIPNRFYPNFTLLMENMTGMISDPTVTNPKDALQKPYDDLGPNWEVRDTRLRPSMIVAAIPLEIDGLKVVAAAGFAHAYDLDYFTQNNNSLDPNIGRYRPSPIPVLRGTDTLAVRWFTSFADRKGAIYGITPGISVSLSDQLSAGAGVTILTGHSEDFEFRRDRGLLSFDAVYRVQNYPTSYWTTSAGRSDFSGVIGNLGLYFREKYFSLAASFKLPATITREWSRMVTLDTAGVRSHATIAGSDELDFPGGASLGVLLTPTADWNVGIDYVIGRSGDAIYRPAGSGVGSNPWLSANVLRAGVEYLAADWLALRVGYRDVAHTFAPEGTGLIGEPVTGSVYSAGAGFVYDMFGVDLAYEYQRVAYQDLWETNVNDNTENRHMVVVEVSVRL